VYHGQPPLAVFMVSMMLCFFCSGILFGNYTARALEPMGHIAGVAAAINGSVSGLVAIAVGTPLGQAYDGTVKAVILGFVTASFGALIFTESAEWRQRVATAAGLVGSDVRVAPSRH
jgi:DHA1 family bicyclomycin/chloramphenicol resistance-like MFS transporter